MIPLRAERRPRGLTAVTWTVACLCAAAMVRLAQLPSAHAETIVHALAIVPTRLLGSPSPGQVATLLTSSFMHAGWLHLAGNLLFLAVFGPTVEARLGWRGFTALYLGSGIAGGLAYALAHPSSAVPLVGASGAIAGVLGAHLVLEPRARVTTLVPALVIFEIASLPAAFVIALWFLLQVAATVAAVAPGTAGAEVAWVAHVAGFAAGALLASPIAVRDTVRRGRVARVRATARGGQKRAA